MYNPPDEKQAAAIADRVQVDDLIEPLEQSQVISERCARLVQSKMAGLFREVEAQGAGDDEDYWRNLQKQWGFASVPEEERITPMNAANLCPAPTAIIDSINALRTEYSLNVSQQKRQGKRLDQMRKARKLIARGLGLGDAESGDVAIVRNASEANNAVNCGFRDWNPDGEDNIVVWDQNHPTNLEAWRLRAQWNGGAPSGSGRDQFKIRVVEIEPDSACDSDTSGLGRDIADKFIQQIDDRTRFVTFTETSNGNGFRIPEEAVKAIWHHIETHHPRCHLHIDATMTWGARPIKLRPVPYCHSLVSSAHKWFLGPKETGILYMAKDRAKHFMPSIFGYDEAIHIPDPWHKMPEDAQRFALLGQRDDVHIINLALTQQLWDKLEEELGQDRLYGRVSALAYRLKDKLCEHGWELVTPRSMTSSWGVMRVKAPQGTRRHSLYQWLYEGANGYRIAGSGDHETFRLCPHIYNTMDDVDRAVQGMNAWRATS